MKQNAIVWVLVFIAVLMGIFCILFLRNMIDSEKRASTKTAFLKILTSSCFVAVGVAASLCRPEIRCYCLLLITGAFAGLAGDLLLALRYVDAGKKDSHTIGGFVAFIIGHILYISYNIIRFGTALSRHLLLTCVLIVLALFIGLAVGRADHIMGMSYGNFRFIITVYSIIIIASTFIGLEIAFLEKISSVPANLFAVGAVCFLISDLILSGTYFGQGRERPSDFISNHLFYFTGQFLIGLSLLF